MNTPIWDFVKNYAEKNAIRLHMPGHKGVSSIGCEVYDITEIEGADVLYNSDGIIMESENNARDIFGTDMTLYSAEGSSLCIRAMLFLVKAFAESKGEKPKILAGRNAHKTFINAAAVLDVDVEWIFSKERGLVSCYIDLADLEEMLKESLPTAVYITSPDYLGNISDIKGISEICHRYGVLLLVDNAHGAYLKFLESSLHPMDLGADICCDSAHKTLPAITGSGYLHIGSSAPKLVKEQAERAMSVFASTSPSYLILQSLDRLNLTLSNDFKERLCMIVKEVERLKNTILQKGYSLIGDEPLKLAISAKSYGYTGYEIAKYLKDKNIFCEFSDPDFVVMMMSADTSQNEIERLKEALLSLPKKEEIKELPPMAERQNAVVPFKKAIFMPNETVAVEDALGRVLASAEVACPPAIPVLVCGERIDATAIECFKYYGIDRCSVLVDKCL